MKLLFCNWCFLPIVQAEPSAAPPAKDIDSIITNPKLRAESGSKSKWSLSADLVYSGSSLRTPFGQERPNPSGLQAAQRVKMLGELSARYRWSPEASVQFGTGAQIIAPFNGGDRSWEFKTPFVGYNRFFKKYGSQMRASFVGRLATQENERKIGQQGSLSSLYRFVVPFPSVNLNIGSSSTIEYVVFDPYEDVAKGTYDWRAHWLVPFVEYSCTDWLQVRSALALAGHTRPRNRESWSLHPTPIFQSLGLGWVVRRDIYIYTYLAFDPENIRDDAISVSASANISLF